MISRSVSPGKERNVISLAAFGEGNLFSLPGNQKSGKQISHLGFLIGHQQSTLTKILIFLRFSDKILTGPFCTLLDLAHSYISTWR